MEKNILLLRHFQSIKIKIYFAVISFFINNEH